MNSTCSVDESGTHDAAWDSSGPEPAVGDADARRGSGGSGQGTVVERLSRYSVRVMPSAFLRRSRLQRRLEDTDSSAPAELQRDAPPRASLTPAMRKNYVKELLLSNNPSSHGGFSAALSTHTWGPSSDRDAGCALSPMEHAWMLSAAEGNYDSIPEFIATDPQLLTRKDFISGYSVLHWLAKKGQGDTLVKLLRHAESAGIPVNVNVRGSGGLTPLHVASMHRQYMIVKLLVGAFGADVDAMDYNGRRAWQYLGADAPPEMRELLGTWDNEHGFGVAPNVNRNVNNNTAGVIDVDAQDDVAADVKSLDRTERGGSWRFGSFRRLFPSFSFLGNKHRVV